MRPTKYLTGWSARDRGLAEGLIEYEESLTRNGVPSWQAFDPAQEWEPDETVDGYAAAVEQYEAESRQGAKDGKTAPGLRVFARPKASAPLGRDADREQDRSDEPDERDLPPGQ